MNAVWSLLIVLAASASTAPAQCPTLNARSDALLLMSGNTSLEVSLRCPQVSWGDDGATFGGETPTGVHNSSESGKTVWQCTYEPVTVAGTIVLERVVCAQWSADEGVLRKSLRLRVTSGSAPVKINDIVLETLDASRLTREFHPGPPQSYPLFLRGFFAGVEFPVASTRVESGQAILGHRPLCTLTPDTWYESRRAVYGPADDGGEVLAFHRYIERHRPAPKGMHFNYNSWWTSPVPFSETDILGLMKQFEEHLFKGHGVALDSFTIDLGWSDPQSVWDIDRRMFPDEFAKIQAGAEAMGSRLGLWTSPSSCYPPAVNPQWALDHGYEAAVNQMLSLAGDKYRTKYGGTIADYVARFKLAQVKLDGLYLGGPEFLAGPFPAEATAAGAAEAFDRMRAAGRDVWLEATYSAYASPWWLFHVNSVIGCFGDDSPHGRVPCPVYRESYTTGRDYYNLQGADRLPSPIPAQEILGVIHQTDDCFMNDAVTTVLRGHAFISLYVNPKYMNDQRWSNLAGLMQWSRQNADLLTAPSTQPLRPASWLRDGTPWLSHTAPMPREPYGYAHWAADRGLVLLRNPWIQKQSYTLTIDPALQGPVHAVSLYPEPRNYADAISAGSTVDIPLAPYETLVLSFAPGAAPANMPRATEIVGQTLAGVVEASHTTMRRAIYESVEQPLGADYTSLTPPSGTALEISADFMLTPPAKGVRLRVLALVEAQTVPDVSGTMSINDQEIALQAFRSDAGFVATVAPAPECWHWLQGTLTPDMLAAAFSDEPKNGHSVKVSAQLSVQDPTATASFWLVAEKAGASAATLAASLPSPEQISLDSVCLLTPTPLTGVTEEIRKQAAVEKIDGVFLDTLEPVRSKQGWGTLQKNRSVWEKEMTIGGKRFRRGLGTHANSEIVYQLDGTYRRFQAWAGPDMATFGTLGFTVVVDGVKRWESGHMARGDAPKLVDVDITGAKELQLLVDDAGNGIGADHADWAEAKLLR
jgi:hypothetical protein